MGVSTPMIYFSGNPFFIEKTCDGFYWVATEPRAVGVSSTLAFVEQAVNGHLKMDD